MLVFMCEGLTDLLCRRDFVVEAVCYGGKLFSSCSLSQHQRSFLTDLFMTCN